MEIIQGIPLDSPIVIGLICSVLCVVGVVFFFVFQFLGNVFDVVFGLFDLVINVLQGGPLAWCGCLLVILLLGACGAIALTLTTCGTPNQVNFCRLLGYN